MSDLVDASVIVNPKVFISYSWSSASHEKFVIDLAERLTTDGVIVIIDKWDLKEGNDKNAFMEQMVTDHSVEKVLIISDKKYAEKADKKTGGVGTESQIISSEIYNKVNQTKFIPIVSEFDNEGNPCLPVFLKNRIYINFGDNSIIQDEYHKLIRNIYNKPVYSKPALGIPPLFVIEEKQQNIITRQKFILLKDAISNSKPNSKLVCSEYFNLFIEGLKTISLPETDPAKIPDDQVIDALHKIKTYRDELVEVYKFIVTSSNDNDYYNIIFDFFESLFQLIFRDELNSPEWWKDHYRFFIMENFLYFTAILIKNKKINELNFFTEEKYFKTKGYDKGSYIFTDFNFYIRSVEESRKRRLKLNSISITADLMKQRSDLSYVDFEELMQADFILSLKSTFDNENVHSYWFPRTLVYKGWSSRSPFPIFQRAESKRHLDLLLNLFKANTKNEFIAKYKKASVIHDFSKRWRLDYESIPFEAYMNLDQLYQG